MAAAVTIPRYTRTAEDVPKKNVVQPSIASVAMNKLFKIQSKV
jgi:hypothetical protein